ncbi:unnamed protein product [Ciceribacter sp. T2.26MG-112.2]|uniref:hypothetical protein n=1 Tax=Ciceribacter sp. T2.26MG-112.2 TaxID=3137154 RepID=UPI000E19D4F5|nr:hypothetical protein [Ciceribacter naphthalenivorans]MCA1970382.1 hypothetical protein [Rhizobium sp.]SSC70831.1 unnamed protein product [Ciceribacter naphthalenivorans]
MSRDKKIDQAELERERRQEDMPAAGPHGRKELTDPMKTPGTGSLPEPGASKTDVGPD